MHPPNNNDAVIYSDIPIILHNVNKVLCRHKAMLHEAIFLATCNATNVALQVARKHSRVTHHFATAIVELRVARKVERPSTFRNVARQVACVQHPLCNLEGFYSSSLRCKLQEKLPRVTWPIVFIGIFSLTCYA